MNKIRILLIERSPIVAAGVQSLLHEGNRMEVVSVVDRPDRIMEHIVSTRPDVIVVNPQMIDFSKRPNFRTLFQAHDNPPIVALVYTYFDSRWLTQFDAVIEIDDPRFQIEKRIEEVVSSSQKQSESTEVYDLSDREREVLVELAKGLMNKEIANKLHISIHTVITHRKNIIRKTGIKSTAGLAVYAMLNNLMPTDEQGVH